MSMDPDELAIWRAVFAAFVVHDGPLPSDSASAEMRARGAIGQANAAVRALRTVRMTHGWEMSGSELPAPNIRRVKAGLA